MIGMFTLYEPALFVADPLFSVEVPGLILILFVGCNLISKILHLFHFPLDAALHHALPLLGVDVADLLHGHHADLLDHDVIQWFGVFQRSLLVTHLSHIECLARLEQPVALFGRKDVGVPEHAAELQRVVV
jgi:hypothetical protein